MFIQQSNDYIQQIEAGLEIAPTVEIAHVDLP